MQSVIKSSEQRVTNQRKSTEAVRAKKFGKNVGWAMMGVIGMAVFVLANLAMLESFMDQPGFGARRSEGKGTGVGPLLHEMLRRRGFSVGRKKRGPQGGNITRDRRGPTVGLGLAPMMGPTVTRDATIAPARVQEPLKELVPPADPQADHALLAEPEMRVGSQGTDVVVTEEEAVAEELEAAAEMALADENEVEKEQALLSSSGNASFAAAAAFSSAGTP